VRDPPSSANGWPIAHDGHHARADAYVSLTVIASAFVVALGATIGDPLIGLRSRLSSCASPGNHGQRCD
jgi:hypothetical protein